MIPVSHQQFVQHAISRLEGDARMLGLAAAGSWISGDLDQFSDVDLVVVTDPGRITSVLAEMEPIAHSLGPCLASFPADHLGLKNVTICLYDEPLLHVDLKFVGLDEFARRIENPVVLWERDGALTKVIEEHKPETPHVNLQWIEDRFWTWIHYGATKLGRGELFETAGFLHYLREAVLGPMLALKAHRPARGVRKLELFADAADLADLRSTVATYDARSCEQALKNAAKMYVGLRETLAPEELRRNRRAEMASLRYLHQISEKL